VEKKEKERRMYRRDIIPGGLCTCDGHKCGFCGKHDRTIVHAKVKDEEEPSGYIEKVGCTSCVGSGTICECPLKARHQRAIPYAVPYVIQPSVEIPFFMGGRRF